MEPTNPKRKLIPVKFYLTEEVFAEVEKMAIFMYVNKGLPRYTVGAFAKAACHKWYNEINQIANVKGRLSTTWKKENRRDTTN